MKLKERILIISKAPFYQDILALEEAGFEVGVTQDYPQGLERLDKTSPDLVIIDETLPGVNGWEACSRLRQITDIPIILLGADRSGQAIARAINQGADTYMSKPVSTNELKARINALVRRHKEKEAMVIARVAKEQGPLLDLIDKITDKETSLNIDIEDIGGKLFGHSLRLMGRVNIGVGTLKRPASYSSSYS